MHGKSLCGCPSKQELIAVQGSSNFDLRLILVHTMAQGVWHRKVFQVFTQAEEYRERHLSLRQSRY
jgi:hypothetical protein